MPHFAGLKIIRRFLPLHDYTLLYVALAWKSLVEHFEVWGQNTTKWGEVNKMSNVFKAMNDHVAENQNCAGFIVPCNTRNAKLIKQPLARYERVARLKAYFLFIRGLISAPTSRNRRFHPGVSRRSLKIVFKTDVCQKSRLSLFLTNVRVSGMLFSRRLCGSVSTTWAVPEPQVAPDQRTDTWVSRSRTSKKHVNIKTLC